MLIHLKIESLGNLILKFEPSLDVRYFPIITISNVSINTAFNVNLHTGTYSGMVFYNVQLKKGEIETILVWDKKQHFVHLFPFAGGIDIFNHSLSHIEFDLFIEGVNFIPIDNIHQLTLEKDDLKAKFNRKKGSRAGGIKFVD
jgi:hypothetical protein